MEENIKINNEKDFNLGTFIFLGIFIGSIAYVGSIMGIGPMFKTILNTSYSVLIETVLYICAICVVMGAVSALFTEFGVVGLSQWLINPIMKPITICQVSLHLVLLQHFYLIIRLFLPWLRIKNP